MDTKEGLAGTLRNTLNWGDAEGFARLCISAAHSILSEKELELDVFYDMMASRLGVSRERYMEYHHVFHWAMFNSPNPLFRMHSCLVPERPYERNSPNKSVLIVGIRKEVYNGEMEDVYRNVDTGVLGARIKKFGPIR